LLESNRFLHRDVAVTHNTLDLCCGVRSVAEENEIRQFIDSLRWDLARRQIQVTGFALRNLGKPGSLCSLRVLVTGNTLELQRCMLLVIKRLVPVSAA
jgi:hypothetical protein